MLSVENVIKSFAVFASLSEEDSEHYRPICSSAIHTVINYLKKDISIESCAERLETVCGAIAYYRYSLLISAENCHNIKVGEIQLTSSSNLGIVSAAQIKDEFLLSVSDLLDCSDFVFQQV